MITAVWKLVCWVKYYDHVSVKVCLFCLISGSWKGHSLPVLSSLWQWQCECLSISSHAQVILCSWLDINISDSDVIIVLVMLRCVLARLVVYLARCDYYDKGNVKSCALSGDITVIKMMSQLVHLVRCDMIIMMVHVDDNVASCVLSDIIIMRKMIQKACPFHIVLLWWSWHKGYLLCQISRLSRLDYIFLFSFFLLLSKLSRLYYIFLF